MSKALDGIHWPGAVAGDCIVAGCASSQLRAPHLPAARYLKSVHQSRTALNLFQRVHAALPARRTKARLAAALDMADLYSRTGEIDEGIRVLRELHLRSRELDERERRRVICKLAVLYSRRGDMRRADSLFREGLPPADGDRRRSSYLPLEEMLLYLNEHAALKGILGEYGAALSLCEEGLHLAKRSRSFQAKDAALNLYATRANVALRNFEFEAAIRDYEKALEMAEAIGSLGNQALTLNNLGKVYSQCDRYRDAISAFKEAEKTCLRIDEGPSLVAIHSNLAILLSKIGDFQSMESVLAEGERLSVAAGRRENFFLSHARGLARVFQGKYSEARRHLEKAILEGRALGDHHVTEFDDVYRAEALLFEGRHGDAEDALVSMAQTAQSPVVRRLALARLALLQALSGQRSSASKAIHEYSQLGAPPVIPFLDAWDRVFLGWAHGLLGEPEKSKERLQAAGVFFQRHGLQCMADLVRIVLSATRSAYTLPVLTTPVSRSTRQPGNGSPP